MTPTQVKDIISHGESEIIEFKQSFNNEALISINAFANTKGGWVFIGIANNGVIIGVDINNETLQNWLNEIKQKTEPAPHWREFATRA